jgi:UDP-3-O-[3-hydroxymyristoyl] glucosamine N-acyltransferase
MISLKEIAGRIGGTLHGDGEVTIEGVAGLSDAQPGEISFVLTASFEKLLPGSRASAVIVGRTVDEGLLTGRNYIVVPNPEMAYVLTAELFDITPGYPSGISPKACVAESARVSAEACILPFVYVDAGAVIEKHAVIHPGSFIGRDAHVGEGTVIYANVTVYARTVIGKRVIVHAGAVLGGDGFRYVWDGAGHHKIPQLGVLEIEDDVEIGANTCIDRAALDKAVIGRGTKIDNLVQIGHNVSVGEHSIIVSQVGIAGSVTMGKYVILGGKVGIRDHVTIGNNVKAAGGTGITKDVKDNAVIAGTPHMPHREWLRLQTYLKKLPELFERMTRAEEKLRSEAKHDRD